MVAEFVVEKWNEFLTQKVLDATKSQPIRESAELISTNEIAPWVELMKIETKQQVKCLLKTFNSVTERQ